MENIRSRFFLNLKSVQQCVRVCPCVHTLRVYYKAEKYTHKSNKFTAGLHNIYIIKKKYTSRKEEKNYKPKKYNFISILKKPTFLLKLTFYSLMSILIGLIAVLL